METKLVDQQQLRWFRTSLIGRMPGWSPPVAPVGPYRAISLEMRSPLRLCNQQIRSRLMGADGIVDAVLEFESTVAISQVRLHVGDRAQELKLEQTTENKIHARGELVFTDPHWCGHTRTANRICTRRLSK